MPLLQALFLGLLQGATEFLPVSSSGHLVLIPWLFRWRSPGLAFGVMVHWGTAVAVVGYFRHDWIALAGGAWRALRTLSFQDSRSRLAALVLVGSVPAGLIGWLLEGFFKDMFARPVSAAGLLFVTAAALTLAEGTSRRERAPKDLSWLDALVVGLAQAAAILPGVSRSGMTIAAGMGRGLMRQSAARFSFLLATPIILAAGLLEIAALLKSPDLALQVPSLAAGFLAALASGLASIHFLIRYLQQRSLYPFALYCALLGLAGLVVALFTA